MANTSNLYFNHTTDVSGPVDFFFQTPNQLTGGIYGLILVTTIFAISFLSMQRFGVSNAATASGFITFIVSVIFAVFGIVSSQTVIAAAVIVVVGVALANGDRP